METATSGTLNEADVGGYIDAAMAETKSLSTAYRPDDTEKKNCETKSASMVFGETS